MRLDLTEEDKKRIEDSIRDKFAKVARTPQGLFNYLTGSAGLDALEYDPSIVSTLPHTAVQGVLIRARKTTASMD
jgi:arsenite methyltransferase